MNRLIPLLFSLFLLAEQSFSLQTSASVIYVPPLDKNIRLPAVPTAPSYRHSQTMNGAYITSMVESTRADGSQSTNHLNINQGNLLLCPDTDACIVTPEANIFAKAGAIIFLMESGRDLVVYDLYQSKAKQVAIATDKDKFALEPGQMVVLTRDDTDDFENLAINCHSIGYRRAQQIKLHGDSLKGFAAEFSIMSALAKVQPLKDLSVSSDKKDRVVIEKLIRCAILLGNPTS